MTKYKILYLPLGEYLYYSIIEPYQGALYTEHELRLYNKNQFTFVSDSRKLLNDIIEDNINLGVTLYFQVGAATLIKREHLEIIEVEDEKI